jgi:hypothetical protein
MKILKSYLKIYTNILNAQFYDFLVSITYFVNKYNKSTYWGFQQNYLHKRKHVQLNPSPDGIKSD